MSDNINKDKDQLNKQESNPVLVKKLENVINESVNVDAKELAEIEAIQAAIEANDDPIDDIETAAGEASDGGRSVVVDVSRDATEIIASSTFKTESFAFDAVATELTDTNINDLLVNPIPDVNDAATITLESTTNTFLEDTTVVNDQVVSFSTNDEDGNAVTVTLSDTVNYALVGNTVVLTQAGADLVNSGADLPEFTLSATDGVQTTPTTVDVNPGNTVDVNDAATITLESTTPNFTEENAVATDVVASFSTNDEDGDTVTVTLSDTVNYALVGNTVVLTQAGADLVNSGADLPDFTLSATDGVQTTPTTVDVNPGNTVDVNDAATITVETTTVSFTEEDAVATDVVASFSTNDEDGDTVTVTLSDTVNYALVGNTVVLTQAGADLVNSGADLPDFILSATDGKQTSPATVDVNPGNTIDVNDAATITLESTTPNFTEENAVATDVVASFSTNDEDGDTVTVTLSDTVNYALVGNTVVLTQAGADLVNSGADLPDFTLSATDGVQTTPTTVDVNPGNTVDVNDAATITVETTTESFTEEDAV
ncbi:hypothetical protein CXF85_01975, partial [Colwellia sp. 75C3]|uniref:hypothetical protein n=1 Tax=Colwellia sp. 75C3 TaxID=888425 RepID=UPI000CAD77BD